MLPSWAEPIEEDAPTMLGEVQSALPDWAEPIGEGEPDAPIEFPWIAENVAKWQEEHPGQTPYEVSIQEEAERSYINKLPPGVAGAVRGLQGFATKLPELVGLATGNEEGVNQLRASINRAGDVAAEDREQMHWLAGDIDQAAASIAEIGTASAVAPGAWAPYIAATSTREGYIQGKQAGLEDAEAMSFGVKRGVVETALTYLGNKLLGGGLESAEQGVIGKVIGNSLSKYTPSAAKPLLKIAGQSQAEALEEVAVEAATWALEQEAGIESGPLKERLWKTWRVSTVAGGGAEGIRTAIDSYATTVERATHDVQEATQAVEDSREYEGDPPPTSRDGFKEATGKSKKSQVYREAYADAVRSRQEDVTAQSEVTGQFSTQTSGQFESQSFDTVEGGPDVMEAQPVAPSEPQPNTVDTTEEIQEPQQEEVSPEAVNLEPPDQVDYDPSLTSSRQVWMRSLREYLGLNELDGPTRRGWQKVLQEAKDKGIPEDALAISAQVIAKPRAFDDVETAGIVVKAAELKKNYELTLDRLMEAERSGDLGEQQTSAAVAERIEQELDTLTHALKLSGTKKGQSLASQKLTVDGDYNIANVTARARLAKGKKLTDSERRGFYARDKEMQEKDARIAELEAQQNSKIVEEAIGIGKKRARPTRAALDQAYALADQLLRVGCDIG